MFRFGSKPTPPQSSSPPPDDDDDDGPPPDDDENAPEDDDAYEGNPDDNPPDGDDEYYDDDDLPPPSPGQFDGPPPDDDEEFEGSDGPPDEYDDDAPPDEELFDDDDEPPQDEDDDDQPPPPDSDGEGLTGDEAEDQDDFDDKSGSESEPAPPNDDEDDDGEGRDFSDSEDELPPPPSEAPPGSASSRPPAAVVVSNRGAVLPLKAPPAAAAQESSSQPKLATATTTSTQSKAENPPQSRPSGPPMNVSLDVLSLGLNIKTSSETPALAQPLAQSMAKSTVPSFGSTPHLAAGSLGDVMSSITGAAAPQASVLKPAASALASASAATGVAASSSASHTVSFGATSAATPAKPVVAPVVDKTKEKDKPALGSMDLGGVQDVASQALSEGYLDVLGKYEGDNYERLFSKVAGSSIIVRTMMGDEAVFDLSKNSYVFEDPVDPCCFVLDHHAVNMVIFKTKTKDMLVHIFASLPKNVFNAPPSRSASVMTTKAATATATSDKAKKAKNYVYPDDDDASVTSAQARQRAKGTSVEDLLEGLLSSDKSGARGGNNITTTATSSPRPRRSYISARLTSQHRKELVDSHIKRPAYSVRRVKMLCRWINCIHIWPTNICILSLHSELCNGLLLAKLLKYLVPTAEFLHLNEKTLTQNAAIKNLEQCLGLIWRSKSVNNSRIPKSTEIYNGNTAKIAIMLQEIFDVYMRKPLYTRAVKVLTWYNSVLRQYNRRLPAAIFEEGDLAGVWPHFQSGVALFCLVYHFFGPNTIGEGSTTVNIDPMRIVSDPRSIADFRANVLYVFSLFRALKIEAIWDPDDWITFPDTEFVVLQLTFVYEILKNKQCSLPPAQGTNAGITSGPNGEPMVAGIMFADSQVTLSNKKAPRNVLLGSGEDALPLLPIDNSTHRGSRYFSEVCPQGLVSNNIKIVHAPIILREAKTNTARQTWNASSIVSKEKDRTTTESIVLEVMRNRNQRVPASGVAGPATVTIDNIMAAQLGMSPDLGSMNAFLGLSPGLPGSGVGNELTRTPATGPGSSFTGGAGGSTDMSARIVTQLANAMKYLENDMQQSQQELDSMEEDLATRYLELEATADDVGPAEYELALDKLDEERTALEAQRLRGQEHFAMRLTSIKSQHQEATARNAAQQQQQQQLQQIAAGGLVSRATAPNMTSVPLPSSKRSATSSLAGSTTASAAKQKAVQEDAAVKKNAEKGWIKLSAKTITHNYHINKMQSVSAAAFKEKLTPPKYKRAAAGNNISSNQSIVSKTYGSGFCGREDLDVLNVAKGTKHNAFQRHHGTAGGSVTASSMEGGGARVDPHDAPPVAAFKRFQARLQQITQKWLDSRNLVKNSFMQDLLANTRVPTLELIAVPEKTVRERDRHRTSNTDTEGEEGGSSSSVLKDMSAVIREEESKCMQYEDECRHVFLQDQQHQQMLLQQQQQRKALMLMPSPSPALSAAPGSTRRSVANSVSFANSQAGQALTQAQTPLSQSDVNSNFNISSLSGALSPRGFALNNSNANIPSDSSYSVSGAVGQTSSRAWSPSAEAPSTSAEVDAAFKWLSVSRSLILADRKNKEFLWSAALESLSGDAKGGPGSKCYCLQWREVLQQQQQPQGSGAISPAVAGSVVISELKGLLDTQDPCSFTLVLGDSTRSLKASGGRSNITVKCNSSGECAKYKLTLQTIRCADSTIPNC